MKTKNVKLNSKHKSGFFPGVFLLLTVLFLISCGGNKDAVQNSDKLSELYSSMNEKGFEIENEWAIPLGGNMISLITNPNYIRFENDSVDIFLPYYGERHSGGAYGVSGGIEYQGPAKNLRIEENYKGNRVIVKFNGKQQSELLDFIVTIFPDGSASTSVNSSERAAISYRGNIGELPEDNK